MPDLWAEREYLAATAPAARRREEQERQRRDNARVCELPPGSSGSSRGYAWTQTEDAVEISFPTYVLPAAFKPVVRVTIGVQQLSVTLLDETAFEDTLACKVSQGESTWSVSGGVLCIELQKLEAVSWSRCGARDPSRDDVFKAQDRHSDPPAILADDVSHSTTVADATPSVLAVGLGSPPDDGDGSDCSDGMPVLDCHAPTLNDDVLTAQATPSPGSAVRTGRRPRPAGGPSTGTNAERERMRREAASQDAGRWAKGTKDEVWHDPRRRPPAGYAGPVTAAEAARRGEGRGSGSGDESD